MHVNAFRFYTFYFCDLFIEFTDNKFVRLNVFYNLASVSRFIKLNRLRTVKIKISIKKSQIKGSVQ